jgi:predicted deacylase
MIIGSLTACQSTARPDDLPPTQAAAPTSIVAVAQFAPTTTPRGIVMPTLYPTATLTPAPDAERFTPTPDDALHVGYSVLGQAITARQFGDLGGRALLLVGGMHGGYEINTVALMDALTAHFEAASAEIPAGVGLLIVRAANPDGLAYPNEARGRFNANGVDLNRNWACDWTPRAFWRAQPVSAGAAPLSEPETAALADFIRARSPAAVLFYHSAADGIFAGDCEIERLGRASDSLALAAVLGEAADYSYGAPFSAYPVTGTAASWVDGLGIPSADVELLTHTDPEFERNLRGVRAVLAWLAERPSP